MGGKIGKSQDGLEQVKEKLGILRCGMNTPVYIAEVNRLGSQCLA